MTTRLTTKFAFGGGSSSDESPRGHLLGPADRTPKRTPNELRSVGASSRRLGLVTRSPIQAPLTYLLTNPDPARQVLLRDLPLAGRYRIVIPAVMAFGAASLLGAVLPNSGGVTCISVIPKATDSAIGATYNTPHCIYVNRRIVVEKDPALPRDRHQLLLFLTGTGGQAQGARAFCELAADLGYHVVSLMYPDDIPATICRRDEDPFAFEAFRMAIIHGGQTPHVTVARADSIENRLAKLLLHLTPLRPKESWGQFLNDDRSIRWEMIAVAGQSQGGGHAALIAIKHRVARVICTGAPKDYSVRHDTPAAWYNEESATPKACFFAFNHRQDPKGCTPEQLLRNLSALGLNAFGPPVDVVTVHSPYHHARILTTSFPAVNVSGENSEGATVAHGSVIANVYAARWRQVWTYMLTENVP